MAYNAGAIVTNFTAGIKDFQAGIKRVKGELGGLASSVKKTGKKMKSAGTKMSAAITGPAVAGFTALTEGTRNFRETLAPLETNAEEAGASMDIMHESMAELKGVTGETDSNVEGLSNLLATGFKGKKFKKVMNNVAGAAIRFKDTLKFEGVADGLQETMAAGSAVGQFGELIERTGVDLKEFNKGLKKAKKNGKTQNYIMKTLAKTGLADVYEKYKQNNKALVEHGKASYNFKKELAKLGKKLDPLMTKLIKGATKLVEWFNNLSPSIQRIVGYLTGFAAALGPIITVVGQFLIGLSGVYQALASWSFLTTVVSWLGTLGTTIAGLSAGPLVAIVAAVAGAIAIFIKWRKEIMNFAKYLFDVFIGTFLKLPKYFPQIWNDIKNITNRGLKSLGNLLSKITNIFQTSWNAVERITSTTWNAIKIAVNKYLDIITTLFLNWTPQGLIIKYWDEIWNYTKKIWNKISNFISRICTKLIKTIKNSKFVKTLSDTFLKMKNNITEAFITMKNKVVNAWNLVTSTVTNSQIWQSAVSIFQNFIDKFMTGFNRIPKLVSSAWNSVIDFTVDAFTNVANDMKSMFNTVVDWIPEKIGEIVGGIKNFWTDVYEYLSNQDLYSVGKNIIGSLADGVRAAMDRVVSSVTDVAKGLSDAAKKALGISSPSKVFAEIGTNIGQGMQEGIESEEESLEAKMSTIKDKLTASINISQAEINPQAKNVAGNISNSEVYNDFRPTVNLSSSSGDSPSEQRRKQEQLLRKLGAQYNAK